MDDNKEIASLDTAGSLPMQTQSDHNAMHKT